MSSDFANFCRNIPEEIWNTNMCTAHHSSFYMFVLYRVKSTNNFTAYSTTSNMKSPHYQSDNYQVVLTVIRTKTVYVIKANVRSVAHTRRCWSEAAPDGCVVWSATACHWRGNRPVAWTATRLCEHCWATLRTLALIIWTVFLRIAVNVTWQFMLWLLDFYVESSMTLYVCRKNPC